MAKSRKVKTAASDPARLASDRLVAAMNRQIGNEMGASLQYVAIASHFDEQNLPQLAAFFYRQSDEERAHAMKFVRFVVDVGGHVEIPSISAPRHRFDAAVDAVRASLAWERTVTEQIYALVEIARAEKDYISVRFLDWFVDEQLEEITTMDQLLSLVERSGDNLLLVEDYLSRHPLVAEGAEGGK